MTKTDLEFFLKQNISLALNNFLLSLLAATLLSLLIQLFYIRYSSTLSSKFEFQKKIDLLFIFQILITTFADHFK